ncbi:MAG: tRNA (adenosine(37)-N6)-threonylcarbamoyltransferase complex ATPase subunit type 1 TsaE [Bacteroidales bacterium]|nr:tRNA (adenosine(37)-N6)-threonylcarbamoyltransferase complex ATPase subunit type 1 TsaE [Bacteroidales bacterium]
MQIKVSNLSELPNAAKQILEEIKERKIIAFYGNMGAGKTTLITELCRALNVVDTISSPTFSLVNEYHTQNDEIIFHFDFYRIEKQEEVYDFGYEEYFYSENLCLIEWPELIENLLPEDYITIKIEIIDNDSRLITVE